MHIGAVRNATEVFNVSAGDLLVEEAHRWPDHLDLTHADENISIMGSKVELDAAVRAQVLAA